MKVVNCIVKGTGETRKIVLVYADGSRNELPAEMSLRTAIAVQKTFRNMR